MIADDAILGTAFNHVIRHVGLGAVNEPRHYIARAIQLRHRIELVLIQKPLYQRSVYLLTDPPIAAIDDVFDHRAVFQGDFAQVAEDVVIVLTDGAGVVFGQQFAVCGVT